MKDEGHWGHSLAGSALVLAPTLPGHHEVKNLLYQILPHHHYLFRVMRPSDRALKPQTVNQSKSFSPSIAYVDSSVTTANVQPKVD